MKQNVLYGLERQNFSREEREKKIVEGLGKAERAEAEAKAATIEGGKPGMVDRVRNLATGEPQVQKRVRK